MLSLDQNVATRLILLVDGTQQTPGSGSNQTTIQRIQAGIKQGRVVDNTTGRSFDQIVEYVPGIGTADDAFSKDRLQASVTGQGYLKQIQDVYESCCKLTGGNDEVWLFGFSRGAFVVRAVAGLLNQFQALTTPGEADFGKDFKKLLRDIDKRGSRSSMALSQVSTNASLLSVSSATTRNGPKVQFVGVFDTVKAVNDDGFDISFNSSIKHMRHAVALHEDRKALAPELIFPEDFYGTRIQDYGRSFIQAHFVGSHLDMGGANKKAGLSLYPLQWMLLEARECGLSITYTGTPKNYADTHDPLAVVFPKPKKKKADVNPWSCTTANGIKIQMLDLREVHTIVRLDENYGVKMTTANNITSKLGSIRQKKPREIFSSNSTLIGYCDWAPQGTIIHPSVYLLLDEHVNVALESKEIKLQRHLEDYRDKMMGLNAYGFVNTGFWLDDEDDDSASVGAIRVLVCGNTGVGKSTLINKTFGVDVTQQQHRSRGIHDVREEITFAGRPDLIVHDSGGFEAGADEEFVAIESFLKEKSNAGDIMDRLHVIWFCVDINSPRTLQTATEKLFKAVSEYAAEVPIVVVATKKDDFLDIEFGSYRKQLKKEGKRFDEEACEQYAEERLQERIDTIRSEMESVPGGRLDACLAISQDDDASISQLSKTTSQTFDTDKVRLLYIRAQVTRIDLKIDLALCEVNRRYKKLIRRATGTSYAVAGPSIVRKTSTNNVTKAIINCFGLPSVSADTAVLALKNTVWKTWGTNMQLAGAELLNLVGLTGTVFAMGIPAWLITGSINASYVVPATCRLFLIMAMDLTLVLARSFKEVTFRESGQPTARDVSAAARNYALRGYAQHVHRDIKRIIPRRNVGASYKVEVVRQALEDMVTKYKDKLMEDVDLPLKVNGLRIEGDIDEDDLSTEADSTLLADLKESNDAYAELDATTPIAEAPGTAEAPATELDAGQAVVELPANTSRNDKPLSNPPVELQGNDRPVIRAELAG